MMILPLSTPMMGILLDMIQTENILQMAPQQKPQMAQQLTFALIGYYSGQYPRMQS